MDRYEQLCKMFCANTEDSKKRIDFYAKLSAYGFEQYCNGMESSRKIREEVKSKQETHAKLS